MKRHYRAPPSADTIIFNIFYARVTIVLIIRNAFYATKIPKQELLGANLAHEYIKTRVCEPYIKKSQNDIMFINNIIVCSYMLKGSLTLEIREPWFPNKNKI